MRMRVTRIARGLRADTREREIREYAGRARYECRVSRRDCRSGRVFVRSRTQRTPRSNVPM